MRILAIDPGTTQSAFVDWENKVCDSGIISNKDIIWKILCIDYDILSIEMIASYGMAVGKEVFETCFWIGRFFERGTQGEGGSINLIYRKDIKLHFCGTPRAKDANVRQAIIDLFGGKEKAIGKKKSPGPLYGVKSHIWAALAVALYTEDVLCDSKQE